LVKPKKKELIVEERLGTIKHFKGEKTESFCVEPKIGFK